MTPLERKGLLVTKGVQMQAVAREVGCSKARVSEVIHGRTKFDTPMTRNIRASIARKVGLTVSEMWPEGGMAA